MTEQQIKALFYDEKGELKKKVTVGVAMDNYKYKQRNEIMREALGIVGWGLINKYKSVKDESFKDMPVPGTTFFKRHFVLKTDS